MRTTVAERRVRPALPEQVKTGDRIRFNAKKVGGAYTISELEVVK